MTVAQRKALDVINRRSNGVTAVGLAAFLNTSAPAAQRLLDVLEGEWFVQLDIETGRYLLTERGRKALARKAVKA